MPGSRIRTQPTFSPFSRCLVALQPICPTQSASEWPPADHRHHCPGYVRGFFAGEIDVRSGQFRRLTRPTQRGFGAELGDLVVGEIGGGNEWGPMGPGATALTRIPRSPSSLRERLGERNLRAFGDRIVQQTRRRIGGLDRRGRLDVLISNAAYQKQMNLLRSKSTSPLRGYRDRVGGRCRGFRAARTPPPAPPRFRPGHWPAGRLRPGSASRGWLPGRGGPG